MSGPSVLERARMALAEIGVDPNLVHPPDEPRATYSVSTSVDPHTRWMLRCTTGARLTCWPCAERMYAAKMGLPSGQQMDIVDAFVAACRAWRPFQRESCGATQ